MLRDETEVYDDIASVDAEIADFAQRNLELEFIVGHYWFRGTLVVWYADPSDRCHMKRLEIERGEGAVDEYWCGNVYSRRVEYVDFV